MAVDIANMVSRVTSGQNLWDAIAGDDARAKGVAVLMDSIISNAWIKTAFQGAMIGTSAYAVMRNKQGGGINKSSVTAIGTVQAGIQYGFGSVLSLLDIAFSSNIGDLSVILNDSHFAAGTRELYDLWQKALIEPNIEGIPISSPQLTTDREIDVGEQMMIVQSTSQKQYWTDNAVPHLKTWGLEGYITVQLSLDHFYISKPSLRMQIDYLDMCASSRRPVLFKDNKGEFRFVQITSLHTEEAAEYNNAIKVSIQLKEYKPFKVTSIASLTKTAPTDKSVMGNKTIK